ncbi:MAG: GTP-binding protein [Velocimicrobium sp.]
METMPVYMINGFLESGKTTFLSETIGEDYFAVDGVTLLLVLEDGLVEYDSKQLTENHTVMELIESEDKFTTITLDELENRYKPERVLIEYNGMWNPKNMKLPEHWEIQQQISFIDASTFTTYFGNMKSLLAEMIRSSNLIIFNRCKGIEDLPVYRRALKAINQRAQVIFEDADADMVDVITEEDLPYDMAAPIVEIKEEDFGIWYIDALENTERYAGKTVQFKGMVLKPGGFSKNYFVPGRMAMTCCADDIAFLGFVCKTREARRLDNKQWINVTAEVKNEFWSDYNGKGPVLYAIKIENAEPAKEEVLNLV